MDKLITVLQSRKFWALVGSLVTVAAGFFTGQIDAGTALNAVIAAFAAYSIGTGIEAAAGK